MIVAVVLGWLAPTPKFPPPRPVLARSRLPRAPPPTAQLPNLFGKKEVVLEAVLDDEKTAQLFAWIARALQGEPEYNNLISAFQAIFGERPTARLIGLRDAAVAAAPAEDAPVGDPIGLMEREQMSLGAMGAGWAGFAAAGLASRGRVGLGRLGAWTAIGGTGVASLACALGREPSPKPARADARSPAGGADGT